jgi:uncharacterized membrane protein
MATRTPDRERARELERRRQAERETTPGGIGRDSLKRVVTGLLGGGLLVRGRRRGGFVGAATAVLGGWLVIRAMGGSRNDDGSRRETGERDRTGSTGFAAPIEGLGGTAGTSTIDRSITVGRPPEAVYEAWRDPETFSQVVGHVADVTPVDQDRMQWSVHGPRGLDLTWEDRIVEAEHGEVVRWETSDGALLPYEGTVRFSPAPGDRGTRVSLSVALHPPGGTAGAAALERLGVVPDALVGTALHRFKSLVESGEIPTLEGTTSGRGSGALA